MRLPEPAHPDARQNRADLRAVSVGLVAWAAALTTLLMPVWVLAASLLAGAGWVARARWRGRPWVTGFAWLLVASAVAASAGLRLERVDRSGVAALVEDRASVRVLLTVTSDPVLREGRFGGFVTFRATLRDVTGRGQRWRVRAPVLVIADRDWRGVALSSSVHAAGRLGSADDAALTGVLTTRGPPDVRSGPPALLRAVDRVRAGIRDAVAGHPRAPQSLVPALVDGDDTGMSDALEDDFRTAGLTHLLAVSGTNLTLIVGFLLILARWCGVRARGLVIVGMIGVAGFVLLARTEPSVVRAAAMGSVALVGMGVDGRERGTRLLGAAVCGLMLLDPWLATSPGFALSAGATAGILLLAPGWRDALMRWTPRWVAETVAVPLAAQLACTPLVAAISGQVSLVAVAANMLAAAAVGPATVLGLLGGLCALVLQPLGHLVAAPAVWCAAWIIGVARAAADLPMAATAWSTTALSLALLTMLCLAAALLLGDLLARRGASLGLSGVFLVVMLVPLPTPGWPPSDWVLVACDIGQGDAIVLNAGAGRAVLVDVGPSSEYVDRCLRRLDVRRVDAVVLSHFHADHVDGLPGVLRGRPVGRVLVGPLADPLDAVRQVRATASTRGVPVEVLDFGAATGVGQLRWQVLAPSRLEFSSSESPPNDGSLVLLVEVRGVRVLLMGDQERPSQRELRRVAPGLRADVLKVAHHGSSKQDDELIEGLGARLAVVSAGRGNDYGHPAASTLRLLRRAGMQVARTDTDGDVAVVVDERGRLRLRTRLARDRPPPGSVSWS